MKKALKNKRNNTKSKACNFENNLQISQGITLISLVITIIILIILAGIGINMAIGENGIFNRAKYAKEQYLNAQAEEEKMLNELYKQLGLEGNLPENTPELEAGTVVKMPNKWETFTPTYVSDKDGKEVISSKKVSSVYAVSVGNGDTVPVPLEFYYVGGTLNSGVVISDNKADQNLYAGKEDVGKELKGNQFVWIPCSINDYNKITWGTEYGKWDLETNSAELPQIEKYNGFYIGRYEAGVATLNKEKENNGEANPFDDRVTFSGGKSLFQAVAIQTGIISGWTWQNYDFTARREGTPVTTGSNKASGNIVVKADSIPYYHADYYTAVEMSRRLYSNHKYVKSGLVTGTQWDMMIKYMQDNEVNVNSSDWGNYDNVSLTNLSGYYTNVTYSTNKATLGQTDGFKPAQSLTTNASTNTWHLLTTASTEQVKKMNLYDVAGNLWEWTQEAAYLKNVTYGENDIYNTYMLRGGSFNGAYAASPASTRGNDCAPNTDTRDGFRPALYL